MPRKTLEIGAQQRVLDARPDRLDLRDLRYRAPLAHLPAQCPTDDQVRTWLPAYADCGLLLDQGTDGACTGFGLAAVINFQHFLLELERTGRKPRAPRQASPAMLYHLARLYDEWPGEDYEGSSCRGALKGWQRHGVCRSALWPYTVDAKGRHVPRMPLEDTAARSHPDRNWDVDALACTLGVYYRVDTRSVVDMQAALCENHAIYVSGTVHEGWAVPSKARLRGHADLVRIQPVARPKDPAGHAYALVGYNEFGFVVQNSWGPGWGSHGFALLPYEDWVTHGTDAWVFTLGVPRQRALLEGEAGRMLRSPRYQVPSGAGRGSTGADLERPSGLPAAEDALERRGRAAAVADGPQPLTADEACAHTVVLDRGFLVNHDLAAPSPAAALDRIALELPRQWLAARRNQRLMVYVHGGLNSEAESLTRVRAVAPHALAHGVYPLFIAWRSGPLETLPDLVEESLAKSGLGAAAPARGFADRLADITDRMLEPLLRGPGGALWGQMKTNALRASSHGDGGARQLVARLAALQSARPGLQIHLVGHSAGSLLLGPMLGLMREAGLQAHGLHLYAPACTAGFALAHYAAAVESGTLDPRQWHVHVLSHGNELDDRVGPYGKSLLMLVSRALEDTHKEPLIGLARCHDPRSVRGADDAWAAERLPEVKRWQKFWSGCGGHLHELAAPRVSNGRGTLPATHGCFDNDVATLGDTLSRIAGRAVRVPRLDY